MSNTILGKRNIQDVTSFEKREPAWWSTIGYPCAVCKKPYNIKKGFGVVAPQGSRLAYVCSDKCYNMYIFQSI